MILYIDTYLSPADSDFTYKNDTPDAGHECRRLYFK